MFNGATGITASMYRILYDNEARIVLNETEFYTVRIMDRPRSSVLTWTLSPPYTGFAPNIFENEKPWHFPCILYKKDHCTENIKLKLPNINNPGMK